MQVSSHSMGMGVWECGGQVAGLLGGWLPWQAQLGHRLSQGCQPAPGGGPPAQLGGWKGSSESTAKNFNSCPNRRPQDHA